MPRAKAVPKKPRAPKGPKLPDPFANGTVLQDIRKKQWQLGSEIGQGGFGLIYAASDDTSGPVDKTSQFVIKIEPHANGPLFCELHFYQRVAKPDTISSFTSSRKLKYLGVPKFIASGSHMRGKENFRFMVMPRFGSDLQKIFENAGKIFERTTVCCLALRLLDALEFIHINGYVHADIKASNLLLGYSDGKVQTDQVYLVDYGLACKHSPDGTHKVYKEDPRRCHDGTIEFTSIDAHKGKHNGSVVQNCLKDYEAVGSSLGAGKFAFCPSDETAKRPSRRGDLLILGFCLLQWLCSRLPWEDKLQDKEYVRDSKIKFTKDLPSLMKKCFPDGDIPDEIHKYLTLVMKLGYEEEPDYNKFRGVFRDSLKKCGWRDEWKIGLPLDGPSSAPPRKGMKRKSDVILDDEIATITPKWKAKANPQVKRQATPRTPNSATSPRKRLKVTPGTSESVKRGKKASGQSPISIGPVSSPSGLVKSPQKNQRGKRSVTSPVASKKVTSPRKAVKSPQKQVNESKKSVTSPVAKVTSPRKAVKSPQGQVNGSTTPKRTTRRKVKRSKAPKVDACMQTSPPT